MRKKHKKWKVSDKLRDWRLKSTKKFQFRLIYWKEKILHNQEEI